MKKRILALILVMLLPCSAYASRRPRTFRDTQNYIYTYMVGSNVTLSGEVIDTSYSITRNEWKMRVKVLDDDAMIPEDSAYAYFVVFFYSNRDQCPYKIGDSIIVDGNLDSMYSSAMVPVVNAKTISVEIN